MITKIVTHFARGAHGAAFAVPAAFLATVLALPVNAGITIPPEPLTTGARVPPNILFVLDNSGSMTWDYLPDTVPPVETLNIASQAYTRNAIYYNPFTTYRPWVDSTGAEMTGGTSYTAAFSDVARVPPFSTALTNLSGTVRQFYVPKDVNDSSSFGSVENYWRYEILTSGKVQQSEWDRFPVAPGYPRANLAGGGGKTMALGYPTFRVPANAVNVTITATGAAQADLFYRYGSQPGSSSGTFTGRVSSTAATKPLSISNPTVGEDIYVGLLGRGAPGFNGVTLTITYYTSDPGCGSGSPWKNCKWKTPTNRSESAELENFATWYSYHRTRYKVAKSGAGRAFADIGGNYRVGYRNIWNNVPLTGTVGGVNWKNNPITRDKPIPVTRNHGLFVDPNGPTGTNNNRTAWYQRLYSENHAGNTPLRMALWEAGDYFENDRTDTGPWGPGDVSEQFVCRQSFTLLTTDGYRNDDSANSQSFDYTGGKNKTVGEQDNDQGRPYASPYSNTLADIAMYFWKNDLRPDLANKVLPSADDEATWQHMVTFAISIGAEGKLDPQTDLPAIRAGTLDWPEPLNLKDTSIDDLWHAAVNGRGQFVMANDPENFTKALRDALSAINERTSSYSNVAANSVSLDLGSKVFNASYISGKWTGALQARSISESGISSPLWNASFPTWSSRKIFTAESNAGTTFPTTAQKLALARPGGTFTYPVTGDQNANYIRGDQSKEGDDAPALRKRSTILGDIINSSPFYVKDSDTLFVGANDGMLHAFDADTGVERFAYVPGIVDLGLLSTISRGDYAHRFFVDGPVVVTSRQYTPGKNYLVGALGRGGKGLFSLDVTDPATPSATMYRWERSDTPLQNMGNVLGKPVLANVKNGSSKPAVVLGNGPNSVNDRAVLIVLDLANGSVIREIDTGAGDSATPNGLSAVTGIYGADGKTLSYAYAGDLLGNVWKFDLTSSTPSAWTATKLFTAKDGGGKVQPISSAIAVSTNPVTGERWMLFGTGRFLTAGDAEPTATDTNTMYGFKEAGAPLVRADLESRTVTVTGTKDGYGVRGFQSNAPLPSGKKGWYVDLPGIGEKIVQDAQVVSTFLITASMMPTGDACEASGTGFINALDAYTGTSAGGSYFDLDNNPDIDDRIGSVPVGSVNIGNGMPTLPALLRGALVASGSGGAGANMIKTLAPRWDRMSWRELRND